LKTRAPIYKILKTSLPAALDLASQPVMWLIEAVLVGRISAAALGGVGFALQIILLTCTVLLTFVMGAIILINRHLGSKDRWGANHILGQTVMAGLLVSVVIGAVWYFGSPIIFKMIREKEILGSISRGSSISGMDSGIQYLKIVSLFAPIILTNFMAVSTIRGSGDTHISMIINVTMNVANLILAPIMIYGLFGLPRMEVKGAALAVGCAHTLGFCMTLFHLRRSTSTLFLSFREMTTPNWDSFKQLFKLGLPTTVEQLVWSIGQFVVMGFVAMMGITELAIHNVFLRIQGVLSMFYMGFAMTAMTHIGQNIGANEHGQAERTGTIAHRTALVFVSCIVVTMILFSTPLLHIFIRKEDAVIADYHFKKLFIIFSLVQIPKAMNTVIVGSLRGAGDIQWIMWINIIGVVLIEVGMNWVGTFIFHLGLMGIWIFQGLDEVVKSQTNSLRFRRGKWKLIRV
jgi:putative MATE family efflux protein